MFLHFAISPTNAVNPNAYVLTVVIQGRQATEMYVVLRGRLQVWEQTGENISRVVQTTAVWTEGTYCV